MSQIQENTTTEAEAGLEGETEGMALPPRRHLPLKASPKDLLVKISGSCDKKSKFVSWEVEEIP